MTDITDAIWKRDEIESPCVKVCSIHPETRTCVGCLRTMDEIGMWSRMTAEDRQTVMEDLPNRAAAFKKRKGGRAARTGR